VVETLADEFDVMDVALAAVKLAHESSGREADDEEIPDACDATVRKRPDIHDAARRGGRRRPQTGGETTRVFLGVGRSVGIRPQDLVGAITGESHLGGRDIGAIEIADRFSLVEVPESAADDVIAALRHTTIKGKKPTVRRERDTTSRAVAKRTVTSGKRG
jgi:ATP-dependent RNA helicase DeaD